MAEKTWFSVVMSSEVEEERIRGILYSKDPSRSDPTSTDVLLFRGDHGTHRLMQGKDGKWRCDCRAFQRLEQLTDCRHIIAVERIQEQSAFSVQWVPTILPTSCAQVSVWQCQGVTTQAASFSFRQ
jgi:hypothetical protein